MTKAEFWQRGEALDYENSTTSVIPENTVIAISTRIGIAGTSIAPGDKGSLIVEGVFEIPKKAEDEAAMGALVYFDGEQITTTASGNTPAGYAAEVAKAGETEILVKLLG